MCLLPADPPDQRIASRGSPQGFGLEDRLDGVIDAAIAAQRVVGTVVLVARNGKTVYCRAAGRADREADVPMRLDAVFQLASVTKPIVTATALRLVEDGSMGLDDPVTCWLPEFRPRMTDGTEPVIRIRHLLSHSAGLSYRFLEPSRSPYHNLEVSDGLDQPGLTLGENLRRLAQAPLAHAPGTAWRYSLATDVLGGIIAQVAGCDLPAAVQRLVTTPLDMADTGFIVTDLGRLVTAYADGAPEPVRMADGIVVPLWEGAVRFAPSRILDPDSYPSGGAGMAGTAGDFLAFLETIRMGGSPILKASTVGQMMTDHVGSQAETQGPGWGFGFGWAVLINSALAGTPQSEGTIQWGGAYGHSWFLDPVQKISVVAFTNTAFEGMSGVFPVEIRNAVYG